MFQTHFAFGREERANNNQKQNLVTFQSGAPLKQFGALPGEGVSIRRYFPRQLFNRLVRGVAITRRAQGTNLPILHAHSGKKIDETSRPLTDRADSGISRQRSRM
jgi:hypothetical protein